MCVFSSASGAGSGGLVSPLPELFWAVVGVVLPFESPLGAFHRHKRHLGFEGWVGGQNSVRVSLSVAGVGGWVGQRRSDPGDAAQKYRRSCAGS